MLQSLNATQQQVRTGSAQAGCTHLIQVQGGALPSIVIVAVDVQHLQGRWTYCLHST